jgi:hypothetical protein
VTERKNTTRGNTFGIVKSQNCCGGFGIFSQETQMDKPKRVELMRPETKQKILAAWGDEFKGAGLPTVEEARVEMTTLLSKPEEHQIEEFISSGLAMGHSWTPLAMIENQMEEWEEPSPEELEALLKRIKGLRYELRPIIAEATKKLLSTLIHRLGGRPLALKPEQHPEVCQEIANLLAKRVMLRDAFKRIGKRYDVSGRTIERVWRARPRCQEEAG